ncbi:MAG: hypothetical protein QOE52_5069 [Mycobacterium sp.]|jgi:hypothetical protein|nr:hypothetical protein [Mycobacterium sp.]
MVQNFFEAIADLTPAAPGQFGSIKVLRNWLSRSYVLIREGGTQFPRLMRIYDTIIRNYNRIQDGGDVRMVRITTAPVRCYDEMPSVV